MSKKTSEEKCPFLRAEWLGKNDLEATTKILDIIIKKRPLPLLQDE
jgi:hypothetical protein